MVKTDRLRGGATERLCYRDAEARPMCGIEASARQMEWSRCGGEVPTDRIDRSSSASLDG
jgi:hypothetical protein